MTYFNLSEENHYHNTMKILSLFACLLLFLCHVQAQNNTLHFDGSDDYVIVPASSSYDLSSGTIECLVKADVLSANSSTILGVRGPGGSRYSFHMRQNSIGLWNGANFDPLTYAFSAGTWYHLAFVCENNSTKFYINGSYLGESSYAFGSATGQPIVIGASKEGANPIELFNGQIDEIRIWNTVRTPQQIQDNKDNSLTGSESGLVALFTFNQGAAGGTNTSQTTLSELKASNNGTLTNFSLAGNNSNYLSGIQNVGTGSGLAWLLDGNAGTTPTDNFIGTKDNRRLAIKTNNQEKMTILPNGFTGIGTSIPSSLLTLQQTANSGGFLLKAPIGTGIPDNYLRIRTTPYGPYGTEIFTYGRMEISTGDQIFMTASNIFFQGNTIVGRTGDPSSLATSKSSRTMPFEANVWDSSQNQGKIVYAGIQNTASTTSSLAHRLAFKVAATYTDLSNGTEALSMLSNGNIGIGITDPKVKLAVNGDIKATKLTVTQTPWADYVFDKSYKLPTLKEVSEFIKANHHLPGIPSEAEVKENGINVGENQALLLKKVEELTLYLIDQDNRIIEQQKTINELKAKQKNAVLLHRITGCLNK